MGLPRWLSGKESVCQCRRCKRGRFSPWVGNIPWSKKWLPTPVFLPGKFHGQTSLAGYRPWDHKELDATEHTPIHTHLRHNTCFPPGFFSLYKSWERDREMMRRRQKRYDLINIPKTEQRSCMSTNNGSTFRKPQHTLFETGIVKHKYTLEGIPTHTSSPIWKPSSPNNLSTSYWLTLSVVFQNKCLGEIKLFILIEK